MFKHIELGKLFTGEELDAIAALYVECQLKGQSFNRRCTEEIVQPRIERINSTVGHKNSPEFISYYLEYIFSQLRSY